MITLITGGIKSGKSAFALNKFRDFSDEIPDKTNRIFLATAIPFDDEMKEKVQRHQDERSGLYITTVEESLELSDALKKNDAAGNKIVLDCLSIWMSNLFYHFENSPEQIEQRITGFVNTLETVRSELTIVTNEVGMGLIPENPLARAYERSLGILNQRVAMKSDRLILMVSGYPVHVK